MRWSRWGGDSENGYPQRKIFGKAQLTLHRYFSPFSVLIISANNPLMKNLSVNDENKDNFTDILIKGKFLT